MTLKPREIRRLRKLARADRRIKVGGVKIEPLYATLPDAEALVRMQADLAVALRDSSRRTRLLGA